MPKEQERRFRKLFEAALNFPEGVVGRLLRVVEWKDEARFSVQISHRLYTDRQDQIGDLEGICWRQDMRRLGIGKDRLKAYAKPPDLVVIVRLRTLADICDGIDILWSEW